MSRGAHQSPGTVCILDAPPATKTTSVSRVATADQINEGIIITNGFISCKNWFEKYQGSTSNIDYHKPIVS